MSTEDTKTAIDAPGASTPQICLPVGAMLDGDFEIRSLIAQGGMGTVYEAHQKSLDRLVAVKILPPALSQDPQLCEQFEIEARAAARLEHPNIVPIYGVGSEGPLKFYAMALVRGKSLDQMLEARSQSLLRSRKTVPLTEALNIVIQVAKALDFAHSLGVIHRDIKPGNILVDGAGKIVVTDFGLAQVLSRGRRTGAGKDDALGTPLFMSPEQARREAADPRSDLYSLGVIFYMLVSGVHPLPRGLMENEQQIVAAVRQGTSIPIREIMPDIDERLEAIITMAMAPNPAERYQTASALLSDIARYQAGLSVIACPDPAGVISEPVRRARRRPPAAPGRLTRILLALSLAANGLMLAEWVLLRRVQNSLDLELRTYQSRLASETSENADAYYRLGTLLRASGDAAGAENCFRMFLIKHPADSRVSEVHAWMARRARQQGSR